MNFFIATAILLLSNFAFSQTDSVKIHVNPKIEPLIEIETKVEMNETEATIKGFRVQLFFDQDKTAVYEKKDEFTEVHKNIPVYIEYNAPNYTLKVGDYRTRLEATKLQAEMVSLFPTSFVVQEKIYLPSITPLGEDE